MPHPGLCSVGPELPQSGRTAVPLKFFQRLLGHMVAAATIAYINRQGGLHFCRMSQLARHLLFWSQKHLRSLHAIHIPGVFNRAVDKLYRVALPGECRGGSGDLEMVRSCSGGAVCMSRNHPLPVVLLPSRGNAWRGCTATQLAPGPAQICISPSEPTCTDIVKDQGG